MNSGVCVTIKDPPYWPADRRRYAERINEKVTGLDFAATAGRGYDTATLQLAATPDEIDRWLTVGLGREVIVKNAAGSDCWRGIVGAVNGQVGGKTITVGPINELGNRVGVSFAYKSDAIPPVSGPQQVTPLIQDAASIDRYGSWEFWHSGGQLTWTDALRTQRGVLTQKRSPQSTREFSTGGGDVSLSLDCVGGWVFASAYVYLYTASASSVTLTTHVNTILDADPNRILSADRTHVEQNGWLTTRLWDQYQTALDILDLHAEKGDANDNPWLWGIFEEWKPYFYPVPNYFSYQNSALSGDVVETFSPPGGVVDPCDVRPGKWLFFRDFTAWGPIPQTLAQMYEDPRALFIQEARFAAPWGLTVNGERIGKLRQLVAKQGGK